tara:strand:+ start:1571 stop:1831 length:261 start_codon:yes stop_codon:yes gene_type:complete
MTTTTKQIREEAINSAIEKDWHVASEGTDFTACVIAWHKDPATNWCRVLTVVDGQYQTETIRCTPTVVGSGYVTDHLNDFKLTTQS